MLLLKTLFSNQNRLLKRQLCSPLPTSLIPRVDPSASIHPYDKDPGANVHLINQQRHRLLGPVYSERIGPDVEVVFIAEPKLCQKVFQAEGSFPKHLIPRAWEVYNEINKVKRGLFFLDGQDWANMRSRLNRTFLSPDAEGPHEAASRFAQKSSEILLQDMTSSASSTDAFHPLEDLEEKLSLWAVESTLRYLFGSTYESENDNDDDTKSLVSSVQDIFKASVELQYKSSETEAAGNTELWRRFSCSMARAMELAGHATDSNMSRSRSNDDDDSRSPVAYMRDVFSAEEVTSIVVDLVIAAADTTATTALWTLHLLALDHGGGESHQESAARSPEYADWCVKEAMRMFPVAPFITRILPSDLDLGHFVIPAGQLVLLSTYTMGRDEANFPLPDLFWPRRFMRVPSSSSDVSSGRARLGAKAPFAFLPFGHGARSCIGRKLATDQLVFLVRRMVETFELRSLNEGETVEMTMRFTGVPDRKIRLGYRTRKRA